MLLAAAVASLVLLATGCSPRGATRAAPVEPTSDTAVSSGTGTTVAASIPSLPAGPAVSDPAPSESTTSTTLPPTPLAGFLGAWEGDDAQTRVFVVTVAQAREDRFAECLRSEGFDYVALDMSDPAFGPYSGPDPSLGEPVAYGIADGLRLAMAGDTANVGDGTPNPNAGLVANLDDAGQAAFAEAEGRCHDAALEAVPDPFDPFGPPGSLDPELGALRRWYIQELAALQHRIGSDPAVVDAEAAWSRCMSSAGFIYAHPTDISADLERRAAPLWDALDAAYRDTGTPSLGPSELAQLSELERDELTIWDADRRCRSESRLDEIRRSVRVRHEREFVQANEDRLALVRDRLHEALAEAREAVGR